VDLSSAVLAALINGISSLDQVIGRMRPRPALVTELAETKNRRLDTESNLKEACTAHHKAEDDLAAARLSLRDADKALAGVKFDRALFDTLDATRAAGFTDEAAAAQSELNRSDEQQISRRVEAHRHE
jgi:hypothetical protein